jgi:hypothetical protein
MKTKVIVLSAVAVLGAGIALHVGHEPKCLMKMGLVKKHTEVKQQPAAMENKATERQVPAY